MRTLFFFYVLCVLLTSCESSPQQKTPDNLLSREQFSNVLYEVNLLEGYLTNQNIGIPNIRDNSLGQYKTVLEKLGVTYEQYQQNYEYYVQQEDFKTISEEVLKRLKAKEQELKDIPELKQMSFGEFKLLLKQDKFDVHFKNDTNENIVFKLDSVLTFYRKNQDKLKLIHIDSLSFETSIKRYKNDEKLFQSMVDKIIKEIK